MVAIMQSALCYRPTPIPLSVTQADHRISQNGWS